VQRDAFTTVALLASWPWPIPEVDDGLSPERAQQIIYRMGDYCAKPASKGRQLGGVLSVHIGAVNREQHDNHQGCQKP
jgi:hypothetical protein